jgi:hypothetical protein
MDEIDAIGGRRFSEGTSADREIQRTLMELLNQMDGFDSLGQVRNGAFRMSNTQYSQYSNQICAVFAGQNDNGNQSSRHIRSSIIASWTS